MGTLVFGAFALIIAALTGILPMVLWLPNRRHIGRSPRRLRTALMMYTLCGEAALLTLLSFAVTETMRAADIRLADVNPYLMSSWILALVVVNGVGLALLIVGAAIDPRLRGRLGRR